MRKHLNLIVLVFLLIIILVGFLLTGLVSAHETDFPHDEPASTESELGLPSNLQKVADYNTKQAEFYFQHLSFLIAFLAGIIGILTPCSLAILPAFFAYSFKEKREITKMTFIFFLGFAPIFIIFGLLATFFGKTLATFQSDNSFLVIISGIVLIIFGLMVLSGKGFSGIKISRKTNKSPLGIFLFGIFYAIGFTACMGPILVGILLIAGVLQNYFYAAFLMLFYSVGLFVPLFLISMFSDKFNFSRIINNINKKIGFSITNLLAGLLLIGMGIIFIIYKGTYIFNYIGLGDITFLVYRLQEKIVNVKYVNVFGTLILLGFLYLLWRFLRKESIEKKK